MSAARQSESLRRSRRVDEVRAILTRRRQRPELLGLAGRRRVSGRRRVDGNGFAAEDARVRCRRDVDQKLDVLLQLRHLLLERRELLRGHRLLAAGRRGDSRVHTIAAADVNAAAAESKQSPPPDQVRSAGVMLRRIAVTTLLAGIFAAPASAAPIRGQTLMPGVVYSRQVEFTSHGPVVIHVLSAPKPVGGLYQLKPVLSNNAIIGRERVTSMQRSVSSVATVAGVNGDLFAWKDGHPTGALIRAGVLDSAPSAERSTIGVDTDGNLRVERVAMSGTWKGTGQRRRLGIHEPVSRRTTLYTPTWGPRTPAESNAVAVTLESFPAARPNADLTATVTQVAQGGNQPIPPGGAVLVARADAQFLTQEAPVGTTLSVNLLLTPQWRNVTDALGGGPIIVRNGKPVFRSLELFTPAQLATRNPRTAVGQTADGRILLVAVDGRQPGYSTGLTNFELALLMMRLGAVTASALDAGGSTTMAFDGKLLNRPSDPGGERAVAETLAVLYKGVYAPPPALDVVSPNGDGIGERQQLAYKVVRPSTVTASLVGPGG